MTSPSNSGGSSGSSSGSSSASGSSSGGTSASSGTGQIAIDVEFTLLTPDQLRKVQFGLTKTIEGSDTLWTITFNLFERTSTTANFPTDADVSLTVKVDPTLNNQAEKTAKGLTPSQTAQATGQAAEAAKAAKSGQLPQSVANQQVQKVLQS